MSPDNIGIKDCFWGAERCVPGSNGACKNCTEAQKQKKDKTKTKAGNVGKEESDENDE